MYRMLKNGRDVEIKEPWTREFRPSGTYEPIDPKRVVGIDTESFKWDGVLTTTMIPAHTWDSPVMIDLERGDSPLVRMFDWLIAAFGVHEDRPSRTRQRSRGGRLGRVGKKDGRDGRRESVDPIVLVWYNAEYDLGRLMEHEESLLRAVAVGQDAYEIEVGGYSLEVAHMCPSGSAPSFEWYIRRDHRVVRVLGRDMWGYWKGGLDKTARALASLGVTAKIKLAGEMGDDDVFKRDWSSLTEQEKETIRRYALQDSKTTREIYLATVELLTQIDRRVIRKDGTIPASAPGAAAKIMFQKAFDQGDNLTVWLRPPKWVSQLGIDAYCGGRVFCRKPGQVEGLYVKDISSAYPDAMRWLPDPARCEYVGAKIGAFRLSQYRGKWGVLVVSGEGLDPDFPALRMHDREHGGRLRYIYGPFRRITATIPEIVLGVVSGRLRVDRVHGGVIMEGSRETSFLRAYVEDLYAQKERAEKDSPAYLMIKLMLNSPYGKMMEVRETNRIPLGLDGFEMLPNWENLEDDEFVAQLRQIYVEEGIPGLHAFWAEVGEDLSVRPNGPPELPLREIFTATEYDAGHYFLPLHAANVTGFVSGKLGLAAWATDSLQGDTDSIFTRHPERMDEYYCVMDEAGYPAPREGLGSFSDEIADASGVLVKTKMYSLITPSGKYKQAHHGIVRLMVPGLSEIKDVDPEKEGKLRKTAQSKFMHDLMVELVTVGNIAYETRERPLRLKAAVRGKTVRDRDGNKLSLKLGEFYSEFRKVALLDDPNLRRTADGYLVWKTFAESETR